MKLFFLLLTSFFSVFALSTNELQNIPANTLLYVSASVLKVRATPDLKGTQIGAMKKGDSFRILAMAGNPINSEGIISRWIKLKYKNQEGYVFAGFVSKHKPMLLYTQEEINQFDKENKAYEKQLADQEQALMKEYEAKGEFYQNCDPCPHYKVNYKLEINKAGCTIAKKRHIKAIMENGKKSIWDAVNEFGDEYCIELMQESHENGSQCSSVPFFEE